MYHPRRLSVWFRRCKAAISPIANARGVPGRSPVDWRSRIVLHHPDSRSVFVIRTEGIFYPTYETLRRFLRYRDS
jgi:hypothetical protein